VTDDTNKPDTTPTPRPFSERVAEAEAETAERPAWKKAAADRVYHADSVTPPPDYQPKESVV